MANKRCFSKIITDSDAFIDMPPTTQNLYFHLAMNADDDGFVASPKRVMKMINSSSDDYKILLAKRFLLAFESGVCVIKHWWIHNTMFKDRYHLTAYQEELKTLVIKENGAYTDNLLTECQQGVNKMLTQPNLTKPNLTKPNLKEEALSLKNNFSKNLNTEFNKVKITESEYIKLLEKLGENETTTLIEELDGYLASSNKRYVSHYATLLNWSRRKKGERNYKSKNIITI